MTLQERLQSLIQLGEFILNKMDSPSFRTKMVEAAEKNPWFTIENTQNSLQAIASKYLEANKLIEWTKRYNIPQKNIPKNIGLTMAGNLPLVGFHDILCTFICGHKSMIKMSSHDQVLLPFLLKTLFSLHPQAAGYFQLIDKNFKQFDAIIATGSNNSSRYFEYYFRNYPHIIRKNRNSVAILAPDESDSNLQKLADDIFSYFGLGCRNVSKLYIPVKFEIERLFRNFEKYNHIYNHFKYANNYIYNKSIYLVNQEDFADNGFLIIKQSEEISSPIAVLYYDYYQKIEELGMQLMNNTDQIQVVVSCEKIFPLSYSKFGESQQPELWDYADGIDSMKFLLSLGQ